MLLSLMVAAPALATPRLVLPHCGAANAMRADNGEVWMSGVLNPVDGIGLHIVDEAYLDYADVASKFNIHAWGYDPDDTWVGDYWGETMAPEISAGDTGLYLTFTSVWSQTAPRPADQSRSCFYTMVPYGTTDWTVPQMFNPQFTGEGNYSPYGRTYWKLSEAGMDEEEGRMRLDSHIYWDNGTAWVFYVYNSGGNYHIGAYKWKGSGADQVPQKVVNYPNADAVESVVEAPCVFYRDGYYYLVYSQDGYLQRYQMMWKKATTVQGLCNGQGGTAFSPLPPSTWDGSEWRYTENMGHPSVFKTGSGQYKIMYYKMTPAAGKSYWTVSDSLGVDLNTFVDDLNFDSNGNILSIPMP